KPMLDMLFDSGEIEPCIIVSTTYYFDPMGDAAERLITGRVPAGDGGWEGIPGNFFTEVVEDIIPAVETKYNTYLTDGSAEAIRASRDHRAFSGYSRGAVMTWRMFRHAFEYFRWFAPMSCITMGDKKHGSSITPEEAAAFVSEAVQEHPELPFFIYGTNGGPEDVVEMNRQMDAITKAPGFSYGTDPAKNNIYYSVSDFYHTDYLVPYYYWNSLKVLFKS
ncbi:MAG: hypothetical protein II781_03550, partial [Clostridia bacterium]|nr:hypothetical protein [Clostridia bacterium]